MTTGNNDKDMDTFFLAFSGQNVAISTSTTHTLSHEIPANGTVITESKPVYYEGILLDYDADYYYLGKTPTEITVAISRVPGVVISIEILEEKEILNSFLAHIPGPSNDSEIN